MFLYPSPSHFHFSSALSQKSMSANFSFRSLEMIFAILAGVGLAAGWGLEWFDEVPETVGKTCYWAAYFFGGYFATRQSVKDLRRGKFQIDFLMIVAALGAASLGRLGEGALLLFLFSMGHALEHFAMGRAKRAIEALAELTPTTAIVKRNGTMSEILVDHLQIGECVIVKPYARIPVDGFVVAGESAVNQAPITGESVPVDKWQVSDVDEATRTPEKLAAAHQVFAGTINQTGALEIQVSRLAADSTLARVIQMVNEASSQKSPSQHFADRFEKYFVPAVLAFVSMLLFVFLVKEEPFAASFYRAMAVLIGASPCALAISTPSAVLSGVARGAQRGVLIKGGNPLENLGQLKAIAFDKTGTLTVGAPQLTDVICFGETSELLLLETVIAVESLSDHPLARAVVRDGMQRWYELNQAGVNEAIDAQPAAMRENKGSSGIPAAQDMHSITGLGISASINGQRVEIGKETLFQSLEVLIPDDLQQTVSEIKLQGRTTMIVRRQDQFLGVIGLMDTARPEAALIIRRLREMGIEQMVITSGDSQQVVDAIARQIGIEEGRGDLMPGDKVKIVQELKRQFAVAMVGDGANDAPALATATVGIAMGAAGSAVALETADVALMGDDLKKLSLVIGLGRQTSRIIRQNILISLGMVAILVPATLLGLSIGWAVIFHEGSTIMVVLNALRLLRFDE
jgi:Zn2+/Cd2+-exporting ATPase